MSFRASLAACFLLSAALPLLASTARADDFSDFRIPPNRGLLWNATIDAQASHSHQDNLAGSATSGTVNGSTATQARWFSDSDPAFTFLGGSVRLQGLRQGNNTDANVVTPFQVISFTNETHARTALEDWSLEVEHRRYPGAFPLALVVKALGRGSYQQRWTSSNDRSSQQAIPGNRNDEIDERSDENWNYQTSLDAGAGIGLGRIRNATTVYDALVLEQRLRSTGALSRPLSPAGRRHLAEVLYARGEYDNVHDRPGRGVWQEIERVLTDDGALASEHLDPYSIVRAMEPHTGVGGPTSPDGIPFSPVTRRTGAFVGLNLFENHVRVIQRLDSGIFQQQTVNDTVFGEIRFHSGLHDDRRDDFTTASLQVDYHRPLGPRWQIDATSALFAPLRKEFPFLELNTSVQAAWLVADRWTATTSLDQLWYDADRGEGSPTGDQASWTYMLNLSYYLEDDLALSMFGRASHSYVHQGPFIGASRETVVSHDETVGLGFTYRFAGWFDAPGMFAPIVR